MTLTVLGTQHIEAALMQVLGVETREALWALIQADEDALASKQARRLETLQAVAEGLAAGGLYQGNRADGQLGVLRAICARRLDISLCPQCLTTMLPTATEAEAAVSGLAYRCFRCQKGWVQDELELGLAELTPLIEALQGDSSWEADAPRLDGAAARQAIRDRDRQLQAMSSEEWRAYMGLGEQELQAGAKQDG